MKINFVSLLFFLVMAASPTAVTSECFEGSFTMAGSTTVYPVALQWGSSYQETCTDSNITVDWELGGSTTGAKRVCADPSFTPIEVATMSRTFKDTEAAKQADGYTFKCLQGDTTRVVAQMPAFNDAVVMIVNADEESSDDGTLSVAGCIKKLGCLSGAQLRWMFSNYTVAQLTQSNWTSTALANSDESDETHLWSELDPACPAIEIAIAGTDTIGRLSGEAELFMKASFFLGYSSANAERLRSAYVSNIDHNDINTYVLETPGAIAFSSYQIAASATPGVLLVPIKSSITGECISPSTETIQDLSYNPLSRLTYMNALKSDCASLLNVLEYIEFTYTEAGQGDILDTYGIPLTEEQLATGTARIEELRAGCELF
jgi:ABC-type phosphate transport system substrate-binding protein